MSVFCMFQIPFEAFKVNCTPAELNGNFAIDMKGKSNILLLLKFSSRTVVSGGVLKIEHVAWGDFGAEWAPQPSAAGG